MRLLQHSTAQRDLLGPLAHLAGFCIPGESSSVHTKGQQRLVLVTAQSLFSLNFARHGSQLSCLECLV